MDRAYANLSLGEDWTVYEMGQGYKRLLPLPLTVPLSLSLATCTAYYDATGADVRVNRQVSADSTHELPLNFKVSNDSFSRPSWAIV